MIEHLQLCLRQPINTGKWGPDAKAEARAVVNASVQSIDEAEREAKAVTTSKARARSVFILNVKESPVPDIEANAGGRAFATMPSSQPINTGKWGPNAKAEDRAGVSASVQSTDKTERGAKAITTSEARANSGTQRSRATENTAYSLSSSTGGTYYESEKLAYASKLKEFTAPWVGYHPKAVTSY